MVAAPGVARADEDGGVIEVPSKDVAARDEDAAGNGVEAEDEMVGAAEAPREEEEEAVDEQQEVQVRVQVQVEVEVEAKEAEEEEEVDDSLPGSRSSRARAAPTRKRTSTSTSTGAGARDEGANKKVVRPNVGVGSRGGHGQGPSTPVGLRV